MFIDDFIAYTESPCRTSPPQYLWWAGLGLISAVAGQGIWTFLRGGDEIQDRLYPNLFVTLLGISGSGTSSPVDEARRLLALSSISLAPDNLNVRTAPNIQGFPSLRLMPRSLSATIDERSSRVLKSFLCDGYDAAMVYPANGNPPYQVSLSLLSACTPTHLNHCFKRTDWHEGLPARMVYVWGERLATSRPAVPRNRDLEADLIAQLQSMEAQAQAGRIVTWSKQATEAREAWAGKFSRPTHMNLIGYWARREITLSKIAVCCALAGLRLEVSLEDWDLAREQLEKAESHLHIALGASSTNPYHAATEWLKSWIRETGKFSGAQLRQQMSWHFHPRDIQAVIDDLVGQGVICPEQANGVDINDPMLRFTYQEPLPIIYGSKLTSEATSIAQLPQ